MSNLDIAIQLATRAHTGQFDKAGQPYILHPLRVMLGVESEDPEILLAARITAILHDTVEDTCITLESLRAMGFSAKVVSAINTLTKQEGENYAQFIDRCALNPIARVVKISDLLDNMNLTRLNREPTERDLKRTEKYREALCKLKALSQSDPSR